MTSSNILDGSAFSEHHHKETEHSSTASKQIFCPTLSSVCFFYMARCLLLRFRHTVNIYINPPLRQGQLQKRGQNYYREEP